MMKATPSANSFVFIYIFLHPSSFIYKKRGQFVYWLAFQLHCMDNINGNENSGLKYMYM